MSNARMWTKDQPNIFSPEILLKIQAAFEKGLVFGYHSYYCGGCALSTWAFNTFAEFKAYLQAHSKPGDLFTIWSVPELVSKHLELFSGSYPANGEKGDLIVPPEYLQRVKAYLEVVEPQYAPHCMNEVYAVYASARDKTVHGEIVYLHYKDDWDEFVSKLRAYSHPGGAVHLFPVGTIDTNANFLVAAKFPNEKGEVPIGGAY